MWFSHDSAWITHADSSPEGRNVSLHIYIYRTRGCLSRAYFLTIHIWKLEFTYLLNSINIGSIGVFLPGDVESFPNLVLYSSIPLGYTRLSFASFVSLVESIPSSTSAHTITSFSRHRTLAVASTPILKHVSRSSSIGCDLNLTFSQSISPNGSLRDETTHATNNQCTFIKELVLYLLNNSCTHIDQFKARGSWYNTYYTKKILKDSQNKNGFIAYLGKNNYKLIAASDLKILTNGKVPFMYYLHLFASNNVDKFLSMVDLQLRKENTPQMASKIISEHGEAGNGFGSTPGLRPRRHLESIAEGHEVPTKGPSRVEPFNPDMKPPIIPLSPHFVGKHKNSRSKDGKPAISSPRPRFPRKNNCSSDLGFDPHRTMKGNGDMANKDRDVSGQLAAPAAPKKKHFRMKSSEFSNKDLIGRMGSSTEDGNFRRDNANTRRDHHYWSETQRQSSDDSCLEELINAQPYMPVVDIPSNHMESNNQDTDESVDVIVDNVAMSPKHFTPNTKVVHENPVGLWGRTTAREVVHRALS